MNRFDLHSLFPLVKRPDVFVYKAKSKDNWVVIKMHKKEEPYKRECEALELVQGKNLPIPEIIDKDTVEGRFVIVQEWLEGEQLDKLVSKLELKTQEKLVSQAGEWLAALQFALSYEDFDKSSFWNRKHYDQTDIVHFSWKDYIRSQVDKWLERIKLREEDRLYNLEKILQVIKNQVDYLSEPKKLSFIHGDYVFRNLLVNQNREMLMGIIDFEAVSIGDPLWDLAKITWSDIDIHNNELQMEFIKGWEQKAGHSISKQRLKLHQSIQALATVAWVDKQPIQTKENELFRKKALRALEYYNREL